MCDPIDRIIRTIPARFFQGAIEQFDAAFMKAANIVGQHIAAPERKNTLSQLRHACGEQAFRTAAEDAGLAAQTSDTQPLGGRYSIVSTGGVTLIRSNIQTHCGAPRATKFRREWAQVNTWLNPLQLDLLIEVEKPPSDRLCAMMVVTANGRNGDNSVPAFVGLGIPRADLSGWVYLEALSDILGRYNIQVVSSEIAIEIKDNAVPTLKQRPAETQ